MQDDYYKAFHHEDLDRWEVFGPDDFYVVASPGEHFYQFAEQTISHFQEKLLAGPDGNYLSRRIARSIQEEIDREIINDLMIASGHTLPPPPPSSSIFLTVPASLPNRKLKATWTVESDQDLRHQLGQDKIIGKSRLNQ